MEARSAVELRIFMAVTLQDLLDAGCHFGHLSHRWNPKMARFIFDVRGGVHIINLEKTMGGLLAATRFVTSVTASGRQVLFVGTKRQAAGIVAAQAAEAGQPYITERWLGGTLTNFRTIQGRVRYLEELTSSEERGEHRERFTKKEQKGLSDEREKLFRTLSGIVGMRDLPGAVFVVDVSREANAIREARSLGIPVIGMVDTNANPTQVDYPIPANDDAIGSIEIITAQIADAARKGQAEATAGAPESSEAAEALA